ncbi:Ina22p KNAG_0M02450 [Huiozyma naganishii CBS 8797]|uniref:Inner membrane assembly complex subunit 22 n=1 Tax=Huiozyma naganishii (strain ATCC MYA-139 / BCRC 22969 / CBS 8797 / KCTC 17520 / NBRC 10181 / NCYC 3082 / Yp74L-3) TaxID=1071383 RepID=J7RT25_HUIN7|nr:hypothetical protein KNAG_0M02450 [Kazachstania naganishii CBS 8797]CCK73098.1 hypothetical protein KNAG_0M02450 [Kazachstania naganishii CBS 8797]
MLRCVGGWGRNLGRSGVLLRTDGGPFRGFTRNIGQVTTDLENIGPKDQPKGKPPASKVDRSLLKTVVWVVIFGSILTHVVDKEKQVEDMERRYNLKIQILENLISRAKTGESVNTTEELKLVNKLFVKDKSLSVEEVKGELERSKLPQDDHSAEVQNEESLEDIWNDILRDINSEPRETSKKQSNKTRQPTTQPDIIKDRALLAEIAQKEEEYVSYSPTFDKHTIVEDPGSFAKAAKDTNVNKFL